MTKEEMSNEFDILYNQVNSNQAPGVDEYEKSVFLTKAQDDIIRMYFDPRGNKFQEGFDGSQKRQYDFSTIITIKELDRIDNPVNYTPYDPRAISFKFPENLFLAINESIIERGEDNKNIIYQIIPISYYDYSRLMQKPYQYPPKRTVWRIITENKAIPTSGGVTPSPNLPPQRGDNVANTICEIIGRFVNSDDIHYKMRYVKKPLPILLTAFGTAYNDLQIDGHTGDPSSDTDADQNGGISCKLPTGVHHEIVQRAVELCTAVYNPSALGNLVGVGNVSATNLGVIQSNNKEKD